MMEKRFLPIDLDIGKILEGLWFLGATSVRILDEDFRVALLRRRGTTSTNRKKSS